jgi:hypothetical protein
MKHQKHTSKTARISLLMAFAGLLTLPAAHSFAGEPVSTKKVPVERLCAIPGFYKEYPLGDGTLIVTCHMISTRACLYLPGPCPQGTAGERYGNSVPAPLHLDIEEGQKFFGHYDEQGEFVIRLVNDYQISEQQTEDGSMMLILNAR